MIFFSPAALLEMNLPSTAGQDRRGKCKKGCFVHAFVIYVCFISEQTYFFIRIKFWSERQMDLVTALNIFFFSFLGCIFLLSSSFYANHQPQ